MKRIKVAIMLSLMFENRTYICCMAATLVVFFRDPPMAAYHIASHDATIAEISTQDSQPKVDDYLENGLEVFKFGMSIEDLNHLLPYPAKLLKWGDLPRLNANFGVGLDIRVLGKYMVDFSQIRYLLIFSKEAKIFTRNPCISRKTGAVYFIFSNDKLFWIHLAATDAADCVSHEPLLHAIADFYGVQVVPLNFGGVGIVITQDEGQVKVLLVRENSPASKAGIRVGDNILAADGQSFKEPITLDAARRLRGPVGDVVAVTVRRTNIDGPFVLRLKRALVVGGERFDANSQHVCFSGRYINNLASVDIVRPTSPGTCSAALDAARAVFHVQ
jgi:hypothetical protein